MMLEKGKTLAIKLMLSVPVGCELSMENEAEQLTWLGMGWLIGRGWVVYRGDYGFRFTAIGRKLAQEYLAEAA